MPLPGQPLNDPSRPDGTCIRTYACGNGDMIFHAVHPDRGTDTENPPTYDECVPMTPAGWHLVRDITGTWRAIPRFNQR